MSTKSDSVTPGTALFPSKSLATDPSFQKNLLAIFKKSSNVPSPFLASTNSSEKIPTYSIRTPLNTEGNVPRTSSPNTSPLHFTSRFMAKSPMRALTIDTTTESSSFNVIDGNRSGPYSATHNTTNQHINARNSFTSNTSGNYSAKYSRAFDSFRRQALVSPPKSQATSKSSISGNFPSTTSTKSNTILGNNFVSSFLSSLTPTNLQAKKLPHKSSSQERIKPSALYANFDMRGASSNHIRKSNTLETENSQISEANCSINKSSNLEISTSQDKLKNKNIYSLIGSLKTTTNTSLLSPAAKKVMIPIPNHEPSKCSVKRNGCVKAYAANTNQGIVRNYNEDRVAIILNIMKPASRVNEEWPKCSFFGVYDGHGGVACADFLRDNLHQYVQ